jgi:pyruvate/2-oxoglutarate dehydrogenase complex dihydrolipoamide dehydrogenase (E3) component
VSADAVLVATGRVPNGDQLDADTVGVEVADGLVVVDEYQRTTARGIFALGDVCSPYQLKHVANHEARVVSTTCCRTGTTSTTCGPPITAMCRRRCSPIRRSPASA